MAAAATVSVKLPTEAVTLFPKPGTGNREKGSVRCSSLTAATLFPEQANRATRRLLGWSPARKFRATEGSVALFDPPRPNRATENFRVNLGFT